MLTAALKKPTFAILSAGSHSKCRSTTMSQQRKRTVSQSSLEAFFIDTTEKKKHSLCAKVSPSSCVFRAFFCDSCLWFSAFCVTLKMSVLSSSCVIVCAGSSSRLQSAWALRGGENERVNNCIFPKQQRVRKKEKKKKRENKEKSRSKVAGTLVSSPSI